MAYNPYNAINSIYNLKGQWTTANASGDTNKANEAAQKAKKYYQELIDNGRGDIAQELQEKNYDQSRFVNEYYAKTGNTAFRPYLYNLGKKYGMSQADIDKAISYDEGTGEVTLGGKNIGKPLSEYDGVSYWKPETLDKEFSDYVSRNGITRSDTQLMKEHNEGISSKINDLFGIQKSDREQMAQNYDKFLDYNYNHNPYESEIGKSIMEDYQWKGAKASENETASGAASNSGNIDSFSAANASRQQAAFTNMGKQAVREDFNQRIANIQNTLNNLGIYQQNQDKGMQTTIGLEQNESQRLFDNDQTSQNNALNRDVITSQVTGVVPESMTLKNNQFFNSDGTLKSTDIDYQEIINNAKKQLETETDPQRKADLQYTIRQADQARNYKIQNSPGYAMYANTMRMLAPESTAAVKSEDKQLGSNEKIVHMNNETSRYVADRDAKAKENVAATNAGAQRDVAQIEANSDKYAVDAETGLGYAELAAKSSGSRTLTSTELKSANEVIKQINEMYKGNSTGKSEGDDIIISNGGRFAFNPNVDRASWLDIVYHVIDKDDYLSLDTKVAIFDSLGITDAELERLENQYSNKGG